MASIQKHGNGWRALVRRAGHPTRTKKFSTKIAATTWAAQIESDIAAGREGKVPDKSFSELLDKYGEEVSVNKRGERWEKLRLTLIGKMDIGKVRLKNFTSEQVGEWRNYRLKQVSSASVRREWQLLSHACTIAVKEWKWLLSNPFTEIPKPKASRPRERIYSDDEIKRLMLVFGENYGTCMGRAGLAFLWALETAMRAGEIAGLIWGNIKANVAEIEDGKTDAARRRVPLSKKALSILAKLPRDEDSVFRLRSDQIDALFRKAKAKALIEGATFHDARATAITRLAKKLNILDLARMVGHRDLRMLQIYYRDTAETIADRLD